MTIANFVKMGDLQNLFIHRATKLEKEEPAEVDQDVIPVIECEVCDLHHMMDDIEIEQRERTFSSYYESNIEDRPRVDTRM